MSHSEEGSGSLILEAGMRDDAEAAEVAADSTGLEEIGCDEDQLKLTFARFREGRAQEQQRFTNRTLALSGVPFLALYFHQAYILAHASDVTQDENGHTKHTMDDGE